MNNALPGDAGFRVSPMGAPVLRLRSKRGKLLLLISSRMA